MTILPIVHFPADVLRKKAKPVKIHKVIDADTKDMLQSMCETMYKNNGIGLAANQVNYLYRLVVIDVSEVVTNVSEKKEGLGLIKMVNPEIVWKSEEKSIYEEGCLSLPGVKVEVERPAEVTVTYTNENTDVKTLRADGILSTCIQHELDHLNGILCTDYPLEN